MFFPMIPAGAEGTVYALAVDVAERRDGGRLPTGRVLDVCDRCFVSSRWRSDGNGRRPSS